MKQIKMETHSYSLRRNAANFSFSSFAKMLLSLGIYSMFRKDIQQVKRVADNRSRQATKRWHLRLDPCRRAECWKRGFHSTMLCLAFGYSQSLSPSSSQIEVNGGPGPRTSLYRVHPQ